LTARRLIVAVLALLLAAQVVRNAAVAALATLHPASAARFWSDHPAVEISRGLADIGQAARERTDIDRHAFAMIDDAAIKSPLSPEPFLVRGVQAQLGGKADEATRAFVAAQWRDPRSMPAAYFLANSYFRAGRPLEGLEQTALLARLSPQGIEAVAPFVAAYARDPSNWPEMRTLFRSQEGLEDSVLAALARNSANADAILAIADAGHRRPNSRWLRVLLSSLVASGDYMRARAVWASVGGARAGGDLIYDADFSDSRAPPPFNWNLVTSTVGLAEREPGKRLHVIFYGDEDGVLASELVLLPPGSYRLHMQIVEAATHPEALRWSVRCARSTEPLASIGLDEAAARGWSFAVPANCGAQWLELRGRSGDVAQQSDVTIGPLGLTRSGANA
jgi:hypothetical protein